MERSLNNALLWHNWNLSELPSHFESSLWQKANALNVSFVTSSLWKFDPRQLVWCQILVFYFLTDATLHFLSKLTFHHFKMVWLGCFRPWFWRSWHQVCAMVLKFTSRRWKTLDMNLATVWSLLLSMLIQFRSSFNSSIFNCQIFSMEIETVVQKWLRNARKKCKRL